MFVGPLTKWMRFREMKELQRMPQKADTQAETDRSPSKNILAADPAAFIIGAVCILFVWAINYFRPGTITIIPGYPFLDAVIIGCVIGVLIMLRRLKAAGKKQEIEEIQEALLSREKPNKP